VARACISTLVDGGGAHVARATGEDSVAEAECSGNTATANGPRSSAVAAVGNNNTATANGYGSRSGADWEQQRIPARTAAASLAQTETDQQTRHGERPCAIVVAVVAAT